VTESKASCAPSRPVPAAGIGWTLSAFLHDRVEPAHAAPREISRAPSLLLA